MQLTINKSMQCLEKNLPFFWLLGFQRASQCDGQKTNEYKCNWDDLHCCSVAIVVAVTVASLKINAAVEIELQVLCADAFGMIVWWSFGIWTSFYTSNSWHLHQKKKKKKNSPWGKHCYVALLHFLIDYYLNLPKRKRK